MHTTTFGTFEGAMTTNNDELATREEEFGYSCLSRNNCGQRLHDYILTKLVEEARNLGYCLPAGSLTLPRLNEDHNFGGIERLRGMLLVKQLMICDPQKSSRIPS